MDHHQQPDTTPVKQPIHEHPLLCSARLITATCEGCHLVGEMYGHYYCNEYNCYVWFHKDCAEAPAEIVDHPSHPQHPLLLTKDDDQGDGRRPCDLCGVKLLAPCYSCSTCEFKVDLTCGIKPSQQTIEHPVCHEHPLVFLKKQDKEVLCELCKDSIDGPSYSCLECHVYYHLHCAHLSTEVNHPLHSCHPLKLTASESLRDDGETEKACHLCGVGEKTMLYHCSICNFTMCVACINYHPRLVMEHTKTHEHPLTRFTRNMAVTCNVCGVNTKLGAYMCLQCGFAVHPRCIGLPRVININRHDHRISFTHHLGVPSLKCGVCRRPVSQYHGAYSCLVCLNYAVHPKCINKIEVWDGKELEGIPEITEDIAPFKVVGDNLIIHFSHGNHILRLHKDNVFIHDEHTRCEACSYQMGFGPIYSCEECCFFLHEKCANLPQKKRIILGTLPYELVVPGDGAMKFMDCSFCGIAFTGFKYSSPRGGILDMHCSSISEPFIWDGHPKPLYVKQSKGDLSCQLCRYKVKGYMLGCDGCQINLCIICATLPKKIIHSNDKHPLTLCWGESPDEKYWCDICEAELDPCRHFYKCSEECGGTVHVECVLGEFERLMPGRTVVIGEKKLEVVLNNHNTRPLCSSCHSRCEVSVILKSCDEDNGYICSRSCLNEVMLMKP